MGSWNHVRLFRIKKKKKLQKYIAWSNLITGSFIELQTHVHDVWDHNDHLEYNKNNVLNIQINIYEN